MLKCMGCHKEIAKASLDSDEGPIVFLLRELAAIHVEPPDGSKPWAVCYPCTKRLVAYLMHQALMEQIRLDDDDG